MGDPRSRTAIPGKYPIVPLLWLLLMLVCLWLVIRTPVTTDLTGFIPKTGATSEWLLEGFQTGPAAKLILIALEGGTEQAKATASRRLAKQLLSSGLFVRVNNGAQPFSSEEQAKLFAYRYLLSPKVTKARFSQEQLREALALRLRELHSPISTFNKRFLAEDPSGEFVALLKTWLGDDGPPDKRLGVWFSSSGERALLLAETRAAGYDLDAQEQAIAVIEKQFAAIDTKKSIKLLLSGPTVIATSSRDAIRAEVEMLSIAASMLVVVILWWAYRSPRPVLLSLLPLLSAILVGVVTVGILFGEIHGITLGFGITLLGVAIDYPIHLFSHLTDRQGVKRSLNRIWPTLRLGAITTAMGYLAMITTDYKGLAQLGIFAIAGLLTAAAFTRWILPALLPPVWAPRLPAGGWWTRWLSPNRIVARIFVGFGVLTLLALVVSAPRLWTDDLAALSPIPGDVLALDRELRAALGAPEASHMIIISASDTETALRRSETLGRYLELQVAAGLLAGFESAAHYLPSQKTQRQRQLSLPEQEQLRKALDRALTGLPFKPGLFEPFLRAVEVARTRPFVKLDDLNGTALGLRVSSLLFQTEHGWSALLPLVGVYDPGRLSRDLVRQYDDNVYYLDMKQETTRLMTEFRDAALVRLGFGAVLITLVMWFGVRDWRRVLAVLGPATLAIIVDVALLLGFGSGLTLFHLVSLLLVLGIGIDYGLFFSRPDADFRARKCTLHAVLVCSGSTIAVFGMLTLSTLPVLKAIGQTVAIGAFISLLMAMVLSQQVAIQRGEARPRDKDR